MSSAYFIGLKIIDFIHLFVDNPTMIKFKLPQTNARRTVMEQASAEVRLIRLPQVIQMTGLTKASIYLKVRNGTFPAPVKISKRAIAWRSDGLQAWIESRS